MSSPQSKLSVLLAAPGWTQARVAERLGVSQSTVNRWTKGTAPEGDHRDALADLFAEALGLSDENNQMRIRGTVGPGQLISMIDRAEQDWTERPPLGGTLTAVRVNGDVLLPIFADHWILFYGMPSASPADLVGEYVVAHLANGQEVVRQFRHGSVQNRWTLALPSARDMKDVEVESVHPLRWIKPWTNDELPF